MAIHLANTYLARAVAATVNKQTCFHPWSLTAVSPSSIWFCSLDVSASSRVLVTGDNVGHVILLNTDGKEVRSP